jgi:hypothetical protein
LLSAAGIAPRGLQVAFRLGADPDRTPSWGDRQSAYSHQRRRIADPATGRVFDYEVRNPTLSETNLLPGGASPQSRPAVVDVPEAGRVRGLDEIGGRRRRYVRLI